MKLSTSEFFDLRGRRCHVRRWGSPGAPQLFLLHGWMDVAATFQFLVDALRSEWQVIAPDWRGFGMSAWNDGPYWFPDYIADLDGLLARYSPDAPARLVGHSMGGHVAGIYAGVRPERVTRMALLEGFGMPPTDPAEAPARYRRWLDELAMLPAHRGYDNREKLAERLRQANPRLTSANAAFLAENLGMESDDGRIMLAADPYHRVANPVLYRLEEVKACWRAITAPVLWVAAEESFVMKRYRGQGHGEGEDYLARLASFRSIREVKLAAAGHNMHHDQPEKLAELLEEFFTE
jgi:pimeloyl-ACP methyl ester carboxylesterase